LIALRKLGPRRSATAFSMNPAAPPASHGRYTRFADFYPFSLTEHANRACRRSHFAGYGCAWVGHFAA
jgi:hypothetical protein